MPVTILVLAIILGMMAVSLTLWVICLRLGLRWVKAEGVTARRIALATVIVAVLHVASLWLFNQFEPRTNSQAFLFLGLALAVAILIPVLTIQQVFQLNVGRSLKVWLTTLLSGVAGLLLAQLLVIPYVMGGFRCAGNSMAPTVLGDHWRGVCQTCGQPNYCSPPDEKFQIPASEDKICTNFHTTKSQEQSLPVGGADHFLIVKFLQPQRWDIIAFRKPDDPQSIYVKRLVGLPGEKIEIIDGAVWADGRKLDLPVELQGLEYLSEILNSRGIKEKLWGTREQPAQLGPDEYFVLGDFSLLSNDSRLWFDGAPGHPPYALPKANIVGVATHTYWPISRWRALR